MPLGIGKGDGEERTAKMVLRMVLLLAWEMGHTWATTFYFSLTLFCTFQLKSVHPPQRREAEQASREAKVTPKADKTK